MNNSKDGWEAQSQPVPIRAYAKAAGILALLSMLAGGFGEAYVPARLISSTDPASTAQNLRAFDSMFRWGFAGYLVEATCDTALALIFYVLLKPVQRDVSLMAAFFGLISTASFVTAELFYYAPTLLLRNAAYLKAFTPEQLNLLTLLSLKLFGLGASIFTVFYGVGWLLRGYLIYRSEYLPKFLGILMTIGGLAFVVGNFAFVLAPSAPAGWLMALIMPGFLALAIWLLTKGVDPAKWEQQAA